MDAERPVFGSNAEHWSQLNNPLFQVIFTRRSRRLFVTTVTELKAIANAAATG